jgi:hypothetical protein
MAKLKNQHFVPKCLLRPFTFKSEGRAINLYNIRNDKLIERAPVKGQCARDYLHGKDGKIEESLSKIEGAFSGLRLRLIEGGYDAADFSGLNFFTYLQLRRTEMAVQRLKENYQQMGVSIFDDDKAPPVPSDHALIIQSLDFCLQSHQYIEDLKIRLIENCTDVDFIVCDDPAVLMNRYASQKLGQANFGVSSSGVTFTMPISPRFAMISYDSQVYTVPDLIAGRIILKDQNEVEALNELQFLKAGENVYFHNWEGRTYVRDRFLAVKDARPDTWSKITFLVPDANGVYYHDGQRYRVGTREEGKKAGTALIQMSQMYPEPTRWFPSLKFRTKVKTFYARTGVGHVRKKEWLRGR